MYNVVYVNMLFQQSKRCSNVGKQRTLSFSAAILLSKLLIAATICLLKLYQTLKVSYCHLIIAGWDAYVCRKFPMSLWTATLWLLLLCGLSKHKLELMNCGTKFWLEHRCKCCICTLYDFYHGVGLLHHYIHLIINMMRTGIWLHI